MKRVWLAFNPNKEKAILAVAELKKYLRNKKVRVISGDRTAARLTRKDLVIALGGDGTLLRVGRKVAGTDVPVLGVNLGGLGFLTEVTMKDLYPTLDKILTGRFSTEERMMLKAEVWRDGKKIGDYLAVNDVVVNMSREARVISLDLAVGNKAVANYIADGLIISTPTGSTAYALSAGGPIVYPNMKILVIAPICPHMLTLRPLIVPADKPVTITLKSNRQEGNLTMDGQVGVHLQVNDHVKVAAAKEKLHLIVNPYKNYFEVLRTKLKWSERA
jgi:NAD+ kinase